MANRSKANGNSNEKKMFNNFLESLEVNNGMGQVNLRNGRSQKRANPLINSVKYDNNDGPKASHQYRSIEDPNRGRSIVNRSMAYESHNSSLINNGINHSFAQNMSGINQSFEYPQAMALNQNHSLGYMVSKAVKNQKENKKLQQQQQIYATQQPNSLNQSQQPNIQRQMVINLSQMKTQNNNSSSQAKQYNQAPQIPGLQPQKPPFNQAYTIDYLKSTKANQSSKKNSISIKQPKEITKRSGTTGGTENINQITTGKSQNQTIDVQKQNSSQQNKPQILASKSNSKSKGRQIVQQQSSHNGISLRRIDKMRASSQLGQIASSQNGTIDFDQVVISRQGAVSNIGNIHRTSMPNSSLEGGDQSMNTALLIKDSENSLNSTKKTEKANEYMGSSKHNSLANISNQLNNEIFFSEHKKDNKKLTPQINSNTFGKELQTKLATKLKELDNQTIVSEKINQRAELYLSLLDEIAQKDSGYSGFITQLRSGISSLLKVPAQQQALIKKEVTDQKQSQSQTSELSQKVANYERVMKEMKKQIVCYKTEIQGIKKMETYLTLENYQKLINEFNSLYDHYKGLKTVNKKIKAELKQSNERERTFLKLLKKTKEYGDQAARLEQEYEKLFKEDQRLGAIEDLVIDSADQKNKPKEMIDKGGILIPKLDLSSILIQRETVDSQHEQEEGEDSGDQEESYYNEAEESEEETDPKLKKDKFELQKLAFKKQMLLGK